MPGVDGGNLLFPWLSPQWQRGFDHVAPYGMLILIALLWSPGINAVVLRRRLRLGDLIGLPVLPGRPTACDLFRFWS